MATWLNRVRAFHQAHERQANESVGSWYHRRLNILTHQMEILMSTVSQLQQDLASLRGDEHDLKSRIASEITNLQAQVAALQANPNDSAALAALDAGFQQLHQALTTDTAAVAAADPGAQPGPGPAPANVADPAQQGAQQGADPSQVQQGVDPAQQASVQAQQQAGSAAGVDPQQQSGQGTTQQSGQETSQGQA